MARDRASAIYNWDTHPTRPSNGPCQAANARPSLGQASVAASKSASDPSSTSVMGSAIRVDMFRKKAPFPLRNIEIRILSNSSTALEMTHNSRLAEPFYAFPTLVLPQLDWVKKTWQPKIGSLIQFYTYMILWIILRFPQTTAFPIDNHKPFGWFWGSCWETSIAPTWPSSRSPNDQHHIRFPRLLRQSCQRGTKLRHVLRWKTTLKSWSYCDAKRSWIGTQQVAKLGGIRSETSLYLSKSEQNGPNNWMLFVYLCYKYYCFTIWDC